MTGKEMCEYICKHLKPAKEGVLLTPEQVWNLSSTGDLDHVFSWYEEAKTVAGDE